MAQVDELEELEALDEHDGVVLLPDDGPTERLEDVYAVCKADPAFAYLAAEAQFVPGHGSRTPRLIVIGEAPGRQENAARIPFVGPSGRLLDTLLQCIRVPRDDCWVTNVIKWRPLDNRTPTDDEVALARPYLRRELAVLGGGPTPPPVLLLGRTALTLVLPGSSVGGMRGHIIERGRWRYVPTYHPAAALRNGMLLNKMRSDFMLAGTLVH